MVTGYTSDLQKMNYDTKRWLIESVSRAFGICIMLRDEPLGLNLTEIRRRMADEASDGYYKMSLEKAQRILQEYQGWGMDEWQAKLDAETAENYERYEKNLAEYKETKEGYDKSLKIINELKTKAVDEPDESGIIGNALRFASEQIISSIEWDCRSEPSKPYAWTGWVEYRDSILERCHEDIAYHEGQVQDEARRVAERLKTFDGYVNFINKYLGD